MLIPKIVQASCEIRGSDGGNCEDGFFFCDMTLCSHVEVN